MAFDDKKNKKQEGFSRPEFCGVGGCKEPCDVYIKFKNISRCVKHYQEDVDEWGSHHKRGSAQKSMRSVMTGQSAEMYQSVKSGNHLMQILKNFSSRGRKAQ